jgi:hypothetical protein
VTQSHLRALRYASLRWISLTLNAHATCARGLSLLPGLRYASAIICSVGFHVQVYLSFLILAA